MTDAPNTDISEASVNAAAEVSYYYEAYRKDLVVIGWANETEATRERWRQSVRVVVREYLEASR